MEHYEQKFFNKELASFYNTIPRNAKLLSGQDIYDNVGIWSNVFRDVLGHQELDNCNVKCKYLLFLRKSNKFIVLLNYFKNINYTTWRSFNSTRSPHMLENFICSRLFFRRVKYCKVVNIGICSDHTAILTIFKITAVKFKAIEKIVTQTNWKLIGYHKTTNELFNIAYICIYMLSLNNLTITITSYNLVPLLQL